MSEATVQTILFWFAIVISVATIVGCILGIWSGIRFDRRLRDRNEGR